MRLLTKHWRFIAMLTVSIAFAIYAHKKVDPVKTQTKSDQQSARSTLDQHIGDVLADVETYGMPANAAIVKLRAKRNAMSELVTAQSNALAFQVAADYNIDTLGEGADKDMRSEFYMRRLEDVRNRLRYTRYWEPVIIGRESQPATVGFDFTLEGGQGGTTLKQKLLRLDILRRVAGAAERWKVSRVTELSFLADGALNTLEQRIPSAQRGAKTASGTTGGTQPLRTIGLTVKAVGTQAALLAFLGDLQQDEQDGMHGRGLAVENFKIGIEDLFSKGENEDFDTRQIPLDVTLVAYSVVPEAELPERSLKQALARLEGKDAGEKPEEDDPFGTGDKETNPKDRPPRRR